MLNTDIKKLLLSVTPSNLTIDGHTFTITKTLGSVPLNELTLPTINIKFIGEGTPSYRSMDDGAIITDNVTSYVNTDMCTIRYTVAASDVVIETTETITYKTGTDIYQLHRVPSIDILSVGTFIKNTDYKLSTDHTSIQWIGSKPANNVPFTVRYTWSNSGYYISNQLIEYLAKDIRGRIFDLIKVYGINIIDFKGLKDISDIYVSDVFNAFTFDFIITYPFTWTTTISDLDAIIANTFTFDLIMNNINIDTISYTKGE